MKRPVLRTQNGIDTLNAYLEETRAYMNKLEQDNAALVDWVWHKKYQEASSQGADHKQSKEFADSGVKLILKQAKGDV